MSLKKAVRLGGSFLDLKEAATDGPFLAVFRVVEFHEVEKATGFDGYTLPVTADVVFCSGPRKGEVHLNERFIGAITAILRGVKNPHKEKGEKPQEPENLVGDEIVARVEVINPGKNNAAAVGNTPSDVEMQSVEEFYGNGSVWNVAPVNGGPVPAQAGTGGSRPW
jgi:hypothetical protein